ncbi:MAG: class I SAM-dependent methyltransferase [Acholeplasmatales bacterium]|nr:class I SAM-dependent methyltransferase [Acholeplasmatales bacterium]
MQDIKSENLELFYDCLEESNNLLYEIYHKPYFDLIEMTVNNILAGEVLNDLEDKKDINKLKKIYNKIKNIDFSVEDVRKAMQAIILRGFKEMRIPNGNTTPDTLGIFICYLLTKVIKDSDINLVDPLCGVGNLLLTVSNHYGKNINLFACDMDPEMVKLTKLTADLINTPIELYLQNSLSLQLCNMDACIFDMPHSTYENNKYFPYEAILHYKNWLKDNGVMIGIVENDFFDYDKDSSFKKELLTDMSILGISELPDNMFKSGKPKIILMLQKCKKDNKCFMVKLPSFSNASEFNEELMKIEKWFENNKD